MGAFGDLLREFRRRSRLPRTGAALTQALLAELISLETGIEALSGATVSNWERGVNQIRRDDRRMLVGLVTVLHRCSGIDWRHEADALLLAGNYRPLDDDEARLVNSEWPRQPGAANAPDQPPTAADQKAMLPPKPYDRLFGQDAAVADILTLLQSPQTAHSLVITGLGGSGKSSLADAAARQAIDLGIFTQVIWLSLDTVRENIGANPPAITVFDIVLHAIIAQIARDLKDQNPARQLARVRHELKRRPYLVIIDNLEDPEDLNLLLKHLKGLGKTSKFLLTARHFPSADADAHVFPIPEMNREEAISLLRHQSDLVGATDFARLPDKELTQLYHIVGGHPQALRLLPSLTRLYTLPQIIAGWHDGRTGYVAQMYEMIYARLWGILQPGEQKLLIVMPLTAYTGALPAQMQVLCGLPDQDFWAALTRLVELCLITPRGTLYEKRYGIHSLTEHFLASLTARSDALRALHEASAVANVAYWRRFLETLPEDHRQKIDVERAHIFRAIHFSLRLPATAVSKSLRQDWLALASHLYRFASQRGFAGEWIPYLEQMIPLFDGNPAVQSSLLNQLGKLYRQAQQIPEAIATHQRFETLARKMGDDVEIARASFALGTDYFSHRDIDTAVHYAQKALDIFTQLDQHRQEKAAVLNLLGAITQSRHDLNASQAYLETAVSIWREIGSVPDLARALNNLALTYQQQDQITSAFACYQEALTALAGSASELDRTLIYLSQGSLYFDTGQYREANAAFNNINLSFLRRSGHLLYLALALNNLGNTAYMQASYHKAEDFLQESASLWRELEIPLELVNTLGRLGDVYRMLEKQDTALSLYEEALHIIASLAGETSGENKRAQQLRHEIQQLRDDLLRRQRGGVDQNDG